METQFSTRRPTRAETARWVETLLIASFLMTAMSVPLGWHEIPFFTLWGTGWTLIAWALLPEA